MIKGVVVDTTDTESRGRIKVTMPSIDDFERWAEPCFMPSVVSIPDKGDVVWLMLEEDDLERPVWMGCMYSKAKFADIRKTAKVTDISIADTKKMYLGNVNTTECTVGNVKTALVGGEVTLDVPNNKGTIKVR